jgi:predicted nuclease with TOPRIM domain
MTAYHLELVLASFTPRKQTDFRLDRLAMTLMLKIEVFRRKNRKKQMEKENAKAKHKDLIDEGKRLLSEKKQCLADIREERMTLKVLYSYDKNNSTEINKQIREAEQRVTDLRKKYDELVSEHEILLAERLKTSKLKDQKYKEEQDIRRENAFKRHVRKQYGIETKNVRFHKPFFIEAEPVFFQFKKVTKDYTS